MLDVSANPHNIDFQDLGNHINEYLEVNGVIPNEDNDMLVVKEICKFGSEFDLKTYNDLVRLSNEQFSKLFRG